LWIAILRKTPERLLSLLFSLLIIKPPHNSYRNITYYGEDLSFLILLFQFAVKRSVNRLVWNIFFNYRYGFR
jgi:hypothetical protein